MQTPLWALSKRQKKTMARLLQIIIALAALSTLWDATLTFVNLETIGWKFEANPIVHNLLTLILVKLIVIGIIAFFYTQYPKMSFDTRFVAITGLLALTAGQFYGGYSHIPILLENRLAESIQVGDGTYTINRPDGTSSTYEAYTKQESTPLYFGKLFFIMTFPIMFSLLTLFLTRKTSKDIKLQKVTK